MARNLSSFAARKQELFCGSGIAGNRADSRTMKTGLILATHYCCSVEAMRSLIFGMEFDYVGRQVELFDIWFNMYEACNRK